MTLISEKRELPCFAWVKAQKHNEKAFAEMLQELVRSFQRLTERERENGKINMGLQVELVK